jgi:phenylacetate-CoA ligase
MVCFGMGTWIAGSYTVASALLLQNEGLNLTVVTPGFNRSESLRILQNLAHNFEQVVIAGIPSFIKDLAETWHASPANKHSAVHFLLAGEPFPELWRSHVTAIQKEKPCHAISILGSADAGLIGFESNFTIELRQELSTDKELCLSVFETDRVPSLFHYDPTHRFIEVDQQQLLVTTNRVVPLIRYNTLDQGGICQPTMQSVITDSTPDRKSEPCWAGRLPLVYLFGRGARSTTLFGANIYAENIQEFLLSSRIAKLTSGRFYMRTDYDGQADQTFVVHVELADGANFSDLDLRQTAVELSLALRQRSSEYARIWEEYGERALPSLQLHPHGCPVHFPTNVHRKYS